MDNTNNNTSTPTSTPFVPPTPSPWPAPVEPTSTPTQPYPTPAPWPAPTESVSVPVQPTSEPTPASGAPDQSAQYTDPNTFTANNLSTPTSVPVQSEPTPPVSQFPWQNPVQPDPSPIPTQSEPAPTPETAPAQPTFGAPDQSAQYTDPNTFTANNLSTPTSVPVQSTPAWAPPQSIPQASPNSDNPMGIESSEQAPTDLSHLIGNSDTNNQTNIQPETLVIPQNPTPDIPTVPATHGGGMPKWLVGLGVGLLIIVAGASAYFILGVGQTPKNTSLPAQEVPAVTQPPAPTQVPIETSAPQAATESSNFGELQGSGSAPQATSEATPNSFDRLRSR